MARGKNIDKEYFPQYTARESRQLIAWPRREKMKTQGEKIKTQGEKIKTLGKNKDRGKKYHIFSPS